MFGVVLKILFWVIIAGYAGFFLMANQVAVTPVIAPAIPLLHQDLPLRVGGAEVTVGSVALAGAAVGAILMAIAATGAWARQRTEAALARAQVARAREKLKAFAATVKAQQDEITRLAAATGQSPQTNSAAAGALLSDADDDAI